MQTDARHFETFAALEAMGLPHAFVGKVPGVDVQADRAVALGRLDAHHTSARTALGLGTRRLAIGEQTHGCDVAVVDATTSFPVPTVDGLLTSDPDVCLGIYVADCCAVYIADPARRAIALLHSGRKGSELGIAAVAIERMRVEFGCDPARLVVQLSPCIRPPNYEVDFAALIRAQCTAAGVKEIHDCGTCTAGHPGRYYSYRAEKGRTGRMLALLAL
jgi:copper oxidase (laccase) domain-containing protein